MDSATNPTATHKASRIITADPSDRSYAIVVADAVARAAGCCAEVEVAAAVRGQEDIAVETDVAVFELCGSADVDGGVDVAVWWRCGGASPGKGKKRREENAGGDCEPELQGTHLLIVCPMCV
jgi:hypothetical protein